MTKGLTLEELKQRWQSADEAIARMLKSVNHRVNSQYCTECEQDSVTCQVCGKLVCGYGCDWVDPFGNVCANCLSRS